MEKQKILVNGSRLEQELEKFADFGRTENNGVTRLSLSEEDKLARDYFRSTAEELGLEVKVDDMGNMYATLEGKENKPPIVMGSHIDSVEKGGRFDGVLGVVAGLEVIRTLVDNKVEPQVPVTVVNFTNEEGARFEPSMMSSGVLNGWFDKENMMKSMDPEGITFEEALKSIGYDGEKENRMNEAAAYLELHIEQGPVLESEDLKVGVVEGVVGMCCYEIEVEGEANHAGTTPMKLRKDPLFATNTLINQLREELAGLDEELVYTIGRMNTYPNLHAVVPEKIVFTLEARHRNEEIIRKVEEIIQRLTKIPTAEGCNVRTSKLWGRDTIWFNEEVVNQLEKSTKSLGYPYKKMISGAGHDAQFIASYIPSAMLFVPSIGGKSHSESELTKYEDCERGANVLLETVLTLAT